MMTFWLISLTICLLLIVILLRSGAKVAQAVESASKSTLEREANNVDAFRDRVDDLAASLAQGQIDEATHEELLLELKQQLIDDTSALHQQRAAEGGEHSSDNAIRADKRWLLLAALFIPLVAYFLYMPLGASIGAYDQHRVVEALSQFDAVSTRQQNQQAVARLQAVLELQTTSLNPDPQLLKLRGDVYRSQANYLQAVDSFEALLAAEPENPTAMASLAEALYLQQMQAESQRADSGASPSTQQFAPRIKELLEQALAINPQQGNALSLLGIQAFRAAQYLSAIDYWQRALPLYAPGGAEWRTLQDSINAARNRAGIAMANQQSATESKAAKDSESSNEAVASAALTVTVSIDRAQLTAADSENTPVFVFARAANGPRMPLAAKRLRLADLPLTITLTERDKMAGRSIADVSSVVVGARLARSGQPVGASGDLSSQEITTEVSLAVDGGYQPALKPIKLHIDRLNP